MQIDLETIPPRAEKVTRERLWHDLSASLRRQRVEPDLVKVRWVLWAAATLYLLFSGHVQRPLLGWGTVLLGVLINGVFSHLLQGRKFGLTWSVVAQGTDIVLLQLYVAALSGGIERHLPLYTTMIITATMRFGIVGTVSSGALGILLSWGIVGLSPAQYSPGMPVILGTILADAVLLAYFAHMVRQQQLAHQRREGQLRDRMYDLMVLNEVSSTVHDLRSEDALQNIVEITTKIMGFQRAALFLTDNVGEMAQRRYYSQSARAKKEGLPDLFIDPELFEAVLKKKGPIVIDGSQGLPDMERGPILQVALPLHGERAPVGVLVADRNGRGTASRLDKEMLYSLVKSAVMAIENASLHRQVRHMANHDGVTDLFNHRYFQETLREGIRRAQGSWPISLLMIEIDKFKRYNDRFGHRQGDRVLFSLARALEISVEPWDGLAARYGGDEFVVILPRVGREEGAQVARTVQQRTYSLVEEMLRKHNLPTITLSIGIATCPGDAQTADGLIEAADQAMYIGKHDGGDQVHTFSEFQRRTN